MNRLAGSVVLILSALIAIDLPLSFPVKKGITPDSEEGGVITLSFTTLVKGAKIRHAPIVFCRKNIKNQWLGQTFK